MFNYVAVSYFLSFLPQKISHKLNAYCTVVLKSDYEGLYTKHIIDVRFEIFLYFILPTWPPSHQLLFVFFVFFAFDWTTLQLPRTNGSASLHLEAH